MDIQEFAVTRIKAGESVVLRSAHNMSEEQIQSVKDQLEQASRVTGATFVMLPPNISIEAIVDAKP